MLSISDENRKWWILIAMGLGGGLILLDETVVGVALPTLRAALNMSTTASHWVISLYMLVFACTAAAGGKLGDVLGFRKLSIIGLSVFGGASLAAGLADNGELLLIARAIQGLGAAVIFPSTVAMIGIAFPPDQRGMAMGIMVGIGTIFLSLGPLVGGFFTELVSWRWIFWINVPIVTGIALVIFAAWVDPSGHRSRSHFDFAGLVTLVGGLGMLVFAIMQGPDWGWETGIIPYLMAGGVVLLAVFVIIEKRQEAPLITLSLFSIGAFFASSLILFVAQFCKVAMVVFGALYLQDQLAMSPLEAGFALLASVAAFPILSVPVGRFADKFGARRPVIGGLTLATLAMAWIGIASSFNNYVLLLPGLVIWGVGMSFCYSPTLRLMSNAAPADMQGQVGGIGATSRLLGGTLGMAICSSLYVTTNSFQSVFFVTASIMLVALMTGWYAIERTH